ncbi:MAG: RecX family transcriptional regulator, partial [Bacteroidales bacterium]|nr:RecX family transcriptional regulator [Bacteroidales bacterium]
DDRRYAEAFARDKAQLTGWGPVKISYALAAKGIGKDVVSEALSMIDAGKASAKLRSLLDAKYRSVQGEADAKLRLLKYALTRGYEYSQIETLVNDIVSGK